MSQSDLARKTNRTPSFISRLASGKEEAGRETIDAIILALDTTYEEAFGSPRRRQRRAA